MSESLHEIKVGVVEGDVLAGKYRVDKVLGAGGMGVVVAAHHLQLDERVALKFLLPEALANPEAVARFDREARAAVKIKSEHVARVIDVGKLETGSPYMVMEYLDGSDLSAWLQKRGSPPAQQVVDFVLQACEAIAEAHSLGIVHRDLKPANLFCIRRPDGSLSIKVLDFGISKVMVKGEGAGEMSMTRTSAIVGSPVYMSPEQMQASKGVDARTDVWALGIILFELLTGSVPFDSATVTELAIRVAIEPPPPVSRYRKDIPPRLEQLIFKCLEKQREQRFQNVGELALALLEFGSGHAKASVDRILGTLKSAGMVARAPDEPDVRDSIPAPRAAGPSVATAAAWGSGTLATHRGKTAIAAAGAVGAIALLGGLLVLRKGPAPAPAPASATVPAVVQPSASPPPTPSPAAPPVATLAAPATGPGPSSPTPPTPAPVAAAVPEPHASRAQRPSIAKPAGKPAGAPGAAAAGAATAAASKVRNCDPPYTIDADGNRVFKKECL